MPFSVRSTSHQPVKRFSRFQADWPWRINTSWASWFPSAQVVDDVGKRGKAGAAQVARPRWRPALLRVGQLSASLNGISSVAETQPKRSATWLVDMERLALPAGVTG
jgi:hypothetical protein